MPRPAGGYSDEQMLSRGYECMRVDNLTCGWLKTPARPKAVICFFHGNGENALDWVSGLDFVIDQYQCALALMEYPGYANTSEPLACSSKELINFAVSGIKTIASDARFDGLPIVLWGRSLGGAVATAAAAETHVAGLILESTFSSFSLLASELIQHVPAVVMAALMRKFRLETEKTIKSIDCHVLVAHSPDDEMIAVSHAQRLIAAAKEPKRFVQLDGGHNDAKHHQTPFRKAIGELLTAIK